MATWYASPTGSGSVGSIGSPISLTTAAAGNSGAIHAGDTIYLRGGIYQVPVPPSGLTFAVAGSSPTTMTVYAAYPGERPIITDTANNPPNIHMANYQRLDGLWIGGTRQASDTADIFMGAEGGLISNWKQIVNCTMWGYYGGILSGSAQYALIQSNRFVQMGGGSLFHPVYIANSTSFPGPAGTNTNHVIMDSNMMIAGGDPNPIVGGGGYALHFFHNNRTGIMTRNRVFGPGNWGSVFEGIGVLEANNFFWDTWHQDGGSASNSRGIDTEYTSSSGIFINNINYNAYFNGSGIVSGGLTVNKNAFFGPDPAVGQNPISLTAGQEAAQIGASATTIDNAIAALRTAFSASPTTILSDSTIETNFATIKTITVPGASPLFHTGQPWYDANPINVGPDSGAPTSVDNFWSAYYALGLPNYDSNGSAGSISDINIVNLSDTSALINFSTSSTGPATAYVEYGPTTAYGSSTVHDTTHFYTEHVGLITGLTANTLYHYRITAIGTAVEQSNDATFTTAVNGTSTRATPVEVNTAMPDMTGATEVTVKTAGGTYTPAQFQTALNDAASAADKRYITVDAGLSLDGEWHFPTKAGTNWCVVRSSAYVDLPEGKRVLPINSTGMFKLTHSTITAPVWFDAGSTYWRIIGAEVTQEATATGKAPDGFNQSGLIRIGTGSETSAADLPNHIGIDRCYVHGLDEKNYVRGVYANGDDLFIIDSYFSKFHQTGSDAQAVLSGEVRRLKVLNNYLEGSGENFMSGGVPFGIAGFVPSDIDFRVNDCPGLLSWKANSPTAEGTVFAADAGTDTLTAAGHGFQTANTVVRLRSSGTLPTPLAAMTDYYVRNPTTNTLQLALTSGGSPIDLTTAGTGTHILIIDWVVKNRFELKTSNRALVYGNCFHGCWPPEQSGYAVNLKLENNSTPITDDLFQDVTFYKNQVYDTAMGITVQAATLSGLQTDPYGKRIGLLYNLVEVDGTVWNNEDTGEPAVATAFLIGGAFFPDGQYPDYLEINHNTVVNANPTPIGSTGGHLTVLGTASISHKGLGFIFQNNVVGYREFGVKADSTSAGTASLDVCFTGYSWTSNMIAGGSATGYPTGNLFETGWANLLFEDFNDGVDGNYLLQAGSPGHNTASDGTDIGADIAAVGRAILHTLDGNWTISTTGTLVRGHVVLSGRIVIN